MIQGDSECRDGHYRPKKDLQNQSEEARLHAAALDSVEDALSRKSQNPVELSGTRIGRAYQEAAGIPAMLNTARYGLREMGPIRTVRTLTNINAVFSFQRLLKQEATLTLALLRISGPISGKSSCPFCVPPSEYGGKRGIHLVSHLAARHKIVCSCNYRLSARRAVLRCACYLGTFHGDSHAASRTVTFEAESSHNCIPH